MQRQTNSLGEKDARTLHSQRFIVSFISLLKVHGFQADLYSDGDKIILSGEADQTPDQEAGDLVFVLAEKEHEVFKRSGADLTADIDVTLAEALCGLSRVVIKHLDGRGLHIDHQKPIGGVLRPGQVLKIDNEGMPIKKSESRGSLYLQVNIKFPEDDWLQDEAVTSKLKDLLPKPDPPIIAETVDEMTYEQDADIEEFGATNAGNDEEWEDEDDDGVQGAQCAQQ